jgi:Tfp pilus assembly protein PilX
MQSTMRKRESGMALVMTLLVLALASALAIGFFAAVTADQRASGIDRDQTQAYAAAHAGLEKLTTDLGKLFKTDFSPSTAQINALVTTASLTAAPATRSPRRTPRVETRRRSTR